MYSAKLQRVFEEKGIGIGDRIEISHDGKSHEGILMPRPGSGSPDCLVLKMDNGYNVGLRYGGEMEIEKVEAGGPREIEQEADYEIGGIEHEDHFEFDESNPDVSIAVTGGTISSRVDYRTGGVSALMEPQELLHLAPELRDFVNVREVVSPFTRMSESMNFSDYEELAETVFQLMKEDKGVIVTHGTDTLHFTAAALSFAIRDPDKPIVLTGAQRSPDRGSTDASMNLICSGVAATSDIAEVGICMHGTMEDDYCLFNPGTKTRKMHTSRRDTFRPINSPPLARISPDGGIETLKSHRRRGEGDPELDARFYGKVALVKAYPGGKPHVIDHYREKGYRGIVIEATGLGHVPTAKYRAWLPAIERAIDEGITVVFAPQTLYGRLNPNVYSPGREAKELGVLHARDMLPETAYVKLAWILAHTENEERIEEMFYTNYAGEFSGRMEPGNFLR